MNLTDRFVAFFAAANDGASPYPWQQALVGRIADSGVWPDIAAPTGSGKSSVVDVHVFLVAEHAAGRLAVRPPRRLVLIAPRRVLVDDQFDRATRLASRLEATEPLADTAAALRGLCTGGARPLPVWRLRGGVLPDNGWRLEPAACQVICTTPQMWGSRLLLRGFGASRASRNIEAGLLGYDAVAIIDEAHLHERLVDTARGVAGRSTGPQRLQVVAMSATRTPDDDQAGLTMVDLSDQHLSRRVRSTKTIARVETGDGRLDVQAAVVENARQLAGAGTIGVFVNDVPTALGVAAALADDGTTVELMCGRQRPADVARLRARRPGLLTPVGDPDVDFLVSTQSLEVGVDLDLPAMVTTIASASALAQRAGRCNRSGARESASFTVISPATPTASGPYEAFELSAAAAWLDRLGGSISPERVAESSLPLPERTTLPALREVDLDTLAMTSDALSADPDPILYLEEPQEHVAEIVVIARRHLDLEASVVRSALVACPPRSHELASLRLGRALDRIVAVVADSAWVVRAENGELKAGRLSELGPLRPGDTLVVPHGARICTRGVLGLPMKSVASDAFDDVLREAPEGAASDAIVPLPSADAGPIFELDPVLGSRAARGSLAGLLDFVGETALAERLRRHRRLSELEVVWCGSEEDVGLLVVRDQRARAEQTPLVTNERPVTVDDHQRAVEKRLRALIAALGADDLDAEHLCLAAATHDEGKRHPRFQRRMGGSGIALAKPLPGHVPDRGDGWRHEQLSAAYAAQASGGDALVVSLVAGHHGRGRPLFDRGVEDLLDGWGGCPDGVSDWARRLFGEFGRYESLRSDVQRRLGVHRLAWLEALLRCADIQVSREGG